ncbi:hypothetical protein [Nocardia sp. NPDC059195]|uniref:hypothetical protein n=1 Tax=Nocardia sp. NPDC059195 TaxID=3346765 RepID=UPI0036A937F1
MSFEVNPDQLRTAAGTLSLLTDEIDRAPHLGAEPVAGNVAGGQVGAELGHSDALSKLAKDVLRARFSEFATLLAYSADTYVGTDLDAARRLAAVADLNSGNPYEGR